MTARRPLACVVANPSKPALTAAVRQAVRGTLEDAGYRVVWVETTPSETGATQAALAVASGARLVVAAGGDGTVRAVAAGVAGSGVELAILPLGTANLAARNLGLPVGRLRELAQVAAAGRGTTADLAWVRTRTIAPVQAAQPAHPDLTASSRPPLPDPSQPPEPRQDQATRPVRASGAVVPALPHQDRATRPARASGAVVPPEPPGGWARPTLGAEHACLVVAGIGFDAALVATTRPALKVHLTWGAYALAALGNLRAPRLRMDVAADAAAPQEVTARCLLVTNGGRLPAGITLVPGSVMDDGWLDVAAIDVVGGLAGWASLARQVLPPHPAHYTDPARSLGRVRLQRAREVTVHLDAPAPVEVDGELLAPAREVTVRLDAGALRVRRP